MQFAIVTIAGIAEILMLIINAMAPPSPFSVSPISTVLKGVCVCLVLVIQGLSTNSPEWSHSHE